MTVLSPLKIYDGRIKKFASEIDRLQKGGFYVSILRLLLFLISFYFFYDLFSGFSSPKVLIAISSATLFFLAAFFHGKLKNRKSYITFLKDASDKEIRSLKNEWIGMDSGDQYVDHNHPFTSDLNIFGKHSLFHFLNRAGTSSGKRKLADWLISFAEKDEVEMRQSAVQELSEKLDFRHHLMFCSKNILMEKDRYKTLREVFLEKNFIYDSSIMRVAVHLLPLITFGSIVGMVFSLPFFVPMILFILQLTINFYYFGRVSKLHMVSGISG